MKSYNLFTAIILLSIFIMQPLSAAVGCMDNSYHAYACNDGEICKFRHNDPKTLHYVPCTCNCQDYVHISRKGKCLGCMHYRPEEADLVINADNLAQFLENENN